jgi:peptidoglycan LD-endopeptidase LytH
LPREAGVKKMILPLALGAVIVMSSASSGVLPLIHRDERGGAVEHPHASGDGTARLWHVEGATPLYGPTPEPARRPGATPGHGSAVVPVAGLTSGDLENNFGHPRIGDRRHHGIDIYAPHGTPVLAAMGGWVVSIREGGAGGLAVYILDRSGRYLFYYAHLDRFEDGLWEGGTVRQGDVIGYVGTTGNARGEPPHLHFEVGAVPDPRRWWHYERLNPYHFLTRGPIPDSPRP